MRSPAQRTLSVLGKKTTLFNILPCPLFLCLHYRPPLKPFTHPNTLPHHISPLYTSSLSGEAGLSPHHQRSYPDPQQLAAGGPMKSRTSQTLTSTFALNMLALDKKIQHTDVIEHLKLAGSMDGMVLQTR